MIEIPSPDSEQKKNYERSRKVGRPHWDRKNLNKGRLVGGKDKRMQHRREDQPAQAEESRGTSTPIFVEGRDEIKQVKEKASTFQEWRQSTEKRKRGDVNTQLISFLARKGKDQQHVRIHNENDFTKKGRAAKQSC